MIFMISTISLFIGLASAVVPPPSLCVGRPAGFFVRDVTNCTAFFHCSAAGVPSRGFCNYPFLFHEEIQACDWERYVNCFSCPRDMPFVELVVPEACNQFIRCAGGVPEHRECSPGLLFDPELNTCNHQHLVKCHPDSAVLCPAVDDPDNRVFIRDANDCGVFFVCVNGFPIREECAPSLHFNPITTQCDWPENTDCPIVDTEPPPTTPPSETFDCAAQPPTSIPIFPHPTDCTRYIICADNHPNFFDCPDGLLFDTVMQRCDIPDRSTCAPGTQAFDCAAQPAAELPIFPHPTDCQRFYICIGLEAIPDQCPADLFFDIHSQQCDIRERAECAPGASRAISL